MTKEQILEFAKYVEKRNISIDDLVPMGFDLHRGVAPLSSFTYTFNEVCNNKCFYITDIYCTISKSTFLDPNDFGYRICYDNQIYMPDKLSHSNTLIIMRGLEQNSAALILQNNCSADVIECAIKLIGYVSKK